MFPPHRLFQTVGVHGIALDEQVCAINFFASNGPKPCPRWTLAPTI